MAKKKGTEPELSDADQALVQRVDAMMDVKKTESVPESPGVSPDTADSPAPIDIFGGQPPTADTSPTGAPTVPPKLLKAVADRQAKISTKSQSVAAEPPEAAEDTAPPPTPEPLDSNQDPLGDQATDQAVDDIVSEDSNDLLKINKLPHVASKTPQAKAAPVAKAHPHHTEHHNPANMLVLILLSLVLIGLGVLYLTHRSL